MNEDKMKRFASEVLQEIEKALASNYNAIYQMTTKHGVSRYDDKLCITCDGKISALRGIQFFIEELVRKIEDED